MAFSPEIRRLVPEDAQVYRAIRLEALARAPDSFSATHGVEAARPLADFAARLSEAAVFGAFLGEDIVGMAAFKQEPGLKTCHKGFVWGVFVAASTRGMGLGAALLNVVMEAAWRDVEQLTLSVVADNAPAIALYRACRFEPYGVEPRALKTEAGFVDELLMVCFRPNARSR